MKNVGKRKAFDYERCGGEVKIRKTPPTRGPRGGKGSGWRFGNFKKDEKLCPPFHFSTPPEDHEVVRIRNIERMVTWYVERCRKVIESGRIANSEKVIR